MKFFEGVKEIMRDPEERKSLIEFAAILILLALVAATLIYHMSFIYGE